LVVIERSSTPRAWETGDVVFDAIADERLTAGDANLSNTEVQKNAGEAVELGPGKYFIVVAVIFRVGGAAIDAAELQRSVMEMRRS